MQKFFIAIIILIISSLLTQSLWAMRCGNRLILRNDHISKIERFCDEPESHTSTTIYKTRSRYDYRYQTYFQEEVPVTIEVMVFNFGPNKFMRKLRLEDGIVTRVETLGYGFKD